MSRTQLDSAAASLKLLFSPVASPARVWTLVGIHTELSLVGNPGSATIISAQQREGHTTAGSLCSRDASTAAGPRRDGGRGCCLRARGTATRLIASLAVGRPDGLVSSRLVSSDDSPGRFSPPMHCALACPIWLAPPRLPKNHHVPHRRASCPRPPSAHLPRHRSRTEYHKGPHLNTIHHHPRRDNAAGDR